METPNASPQSERRDFIAKSCAIAVGGAITLVAPVASLFVAADPLRRATADNGALLVTTLSSLPENGEPRKFPVIATLVDAWNRTPNASIGAVYLARTKDGKVRALNVICPHTGCSVGFRPAENCYHCPCHASSFALDGQIRDPKSPSPRGLDELPVEIRNGTEIWVAFQNFRPGTHEKIPV